LKGRRDRNTGAANYTENRKAMLNLWAECMVTNGVNVNAAEPFAK